jgi:N-acetylmuramoyl-L-alanine amidase
MLIAKCRIFILFLFSIILYVFFLQNCYAADLLKVDWYNISKNTIQFEIFVNEKVKYNAYRSDDNKKLIVEIDKLHLDKNSTFPKLKKPVLKIEHKKVSSEKVRITFILDTELDNMKAISGFLKKKRFAIKLVGKYKESDKNDNKNNKTKKTIIIDAGHGGYDYGATGVNLHIKEKNITLLMAKELQEYLEKTGNYKVILTRKNDSFVSLDQRRNFAKSTVGDIFISLHADAHPDPYFRGASVYTLSEEAFDNNKKLEDLKLKKANMVFSNSKHNISQLITDLVRRDAKNISSQLATLTTESLKKNIIMIKSAHRFAGFRVLNGVDIPSILIELGCLSNVEEEKLLNSYSYRAKIRQAIIVAINRYFTQSKLYSNV